MKMKRSEIVEIWNGLQNVAQEKHGVKFSYAIAKNLGKLRGTIEAIGESTKVLPEYEEAHKALAREHARIGPDGEPIPSPQGQGFLVADPLAYQDAVEALKVETGQDKRDEEIESFMKEEEDVALHEVAFDALPETIRPDVLALIMPMIKEP